MGVDEVWEDAQQLAANINRVHQPNANKITHSEFVVEIINGEAYKYYPLGDHVVRAVGVCGGRPTFKYTRIEVDFVLVQLTNGEQISELIADYDHPHLTEAAIQEALQSASFM